MKDITYQSEVTKKYMTPIIDPNMTSGNIFDGVGFGAL